MNYIKLGKNGLEVSTVGFGAWGISGRDWGNTDDIESIHAIHAALDNGVNFIDTADTYGFGHSEELIAKVLKERSDRDRIVIATKAGNNFYPYLEKHYDTTPGNPDYSKKHLIFAAEQSLKRLNVDVLDILQLHSPSIDLLENDEPWEALRILKEQGKIKKAGWSIQSFKETEQAFLLDQYKDVLDVIQVRYNLLEREAEKILFPKAMEYGIGVIVRIPILFGLLAGKFNRSSVFPDNDHRKFNLSSENLDKYLTQLEKMKPFFEKYKEYSMAQLSLRFCISHPACHTVIPGGKNRQQVEENIKAAELDLIRYEDFPEMDKLM
jgi:aryl-alcohol dehydrogenase-like predicted oxidoreductase